MNLKTLIYKLKTYGVSRTVGYAFTEIAYLFRRIIYGSYSQQGEDLYLLRQFPKDYRGFYVDVGANDSFRFSNTCLFYNRGWRGINIEPDVENYSKIKNTRNRDINLNIGIGENNGQLSYYRFVPHTLNTFSEVEFSSYTNQGYHFMGKEIVPIKRLEDVLEENLPKNTKIDFLSIDTEGFDLQVIKSANLQKFKPSFVCVECVKHNIHGGEEDSSVKEFLEQIGYKEIFTNGLNSIYKLTF